jgi:hypothetical protein
MLRCTVVPWQLAMLSVKVSHLLRCAAVGTTIVSNVIHAHEIGASLDCHFCPHEFIEQLVEEKEIDP